MGDVYGQQSWTAVRLDNEQYLNSAYGAASQYRLQPGDYSFTHIVLTRPGEQIYGEPSILGTNKLIPQPYANYGTVTVQASGTLSNDGPWADVAKVTVNPDGTWNITPTAGAGGAANLAETASHSLPLPPNTTGVRLLQTTKSARATQLYYLQTAYYPTPSLLAAIQASPTYIANREVDMHNKAWHWATGGGMPDSLRAQDSEYFRMTEFEGYSNILKTMRVTGSNSSLAQETAEVTITAHDVLPIPASTTLEEAIALGLLAEQRTGAFYDLLPPGVTFSPATIRTYRYSGRGDTLSSLIVPHTYEIIPDFRGTGCTMLIIRPSIPDGAASNYTVFDNNLRSGFTVQFSIYNSWQNIMDNGNTATNHVAYQSFADKPLFEGHSDIAPSTWLDYVEQAYLDVNGDGLDNAGDFLHAKSTLTFKLLPNIQIGYDKFVKAADENAYTKSTRVMGGGEYSYQLKLTTQAEAHASDLVFYNSLEMDAELPRGRETWMGTLLDYDITHPFRVYNVLPTVYYAARTMDPKAFDADRLFNRDTGELNPGWMLMPSDGSIPADLVSIAFDMRYDREGNPFVLGPELSLIIFMYMRAPADTAPYLPPQADPEILAWNTSFIQMKSAFPTETKEGIDTVNPTTVALRKPDLTLTKTSNPWTGTESAPARVHQDGTITYTVSVRNTNRVETIPDIVLEDDIPQGLIFDENADITVHFTGTAYLPIAQQPRVVMTRTGQKLSFAIDKLDPQETALFSIKTTVGAPTATSPTLFVNQAVVTKAFGVDQEIVSPPTYHKTNKISVTLPARKLLAAGGRVLQPGEFSIQLFDTSGQPVGGPIANDENGNFPITLWFGKPSSSTVIYRYFIREVIPETPEGNMTYHSTQYQWDVQIVYDYTPDTLRLYRSTLTPRLTPMEALFTNTYKASGQAAPTVYKVMQGRALAAGEFAFLLEAVGTAPMNGAAGLPLTLQARTVRNTLEPDGTGTAAFPALYYTEKDIGKTYQYIIRELPSGTPGVDDDTKTITWTVIVGDAGDGQLTFDSSYTDDDAVMGNEQSFLNSIETVSFTAKKRWELAEGITKPAIAIRLYQNGTTDMGYVRVNGIADDEEDMGFKPDGSGEQTPWEYTWETLPKYSYDQDGNETENVYSAVEILVPDHFQHKVDADGTLVNTYRPGTFTGVKLWNGGKTSPVELRLFRTILGEENGARVEVYPGQTFPLDGRIDDPVSLDGSGELTPWVYTWVNLPANTNALEGYTGPFQSFEYEIEEVKIPDGFAADTVTTPSRYITNIALKTDVTVTKLWRDTQRPYPAIRVQLIRDDEPFGDEVELTDGSTSYTWKDLDRFSVWDEDPKKRVEYMYTVSEVSMVGFDTYYSDDFRTITNYFVPPDPVEIVLRARKTLDGRAQKAGEFSFLLLSGGDEVLQSGIRNAADGTVLFQPIRFESPGEGIVFKMREAAGGDRDILYDASVYTLTYDVRLENDNSLSAHLVSLLKDGEEIALDSPLVFANALTPEARTYPVISVPLTARKTLSNGALMAGQFTFTLKDPSGQVVAEATNAADGSIVFPERTFSRKVSNYRFTISEKAGDTRQYTYDTAVYTVLVTTTPANGRLTASVALEKDGAPYEGEILFANIQKLPPTGDSALAMPLWLLLGAFALLAAAWLTRHRTKPAGRNH